MLLLSARRKRRRTLLKEFGQIMSFSFHDPSKLDEVVQASVEELVDESTKDPTVWDNDAWWLEETDGR
jgi:hypothetical protein